MKVLPEAKIFEINTKIAIILSAKAILNTIIVLIS